MLIFDITKTVQNTIREHKLIKPDDFVILGFSGGPDSLCLFHVLKDLSAKIGFTFFAAHINHGIRGREADEDAAWAIDYCRRNGVSCIGVTANVPVYAKHRHMTEEEAGHHVRREVFSYIAYGIATGRDISKSDDQEPMSSAAPPKHPVPKGSVKIALAHNLDDQAETVLMRILRGTGVHGLSGIQYENRLDEALLRVAAGIRDEELRKNAKKLNISVIRPLLDVPRTEIERYCRENELEPRIDHTNSETDYTRNRIRLELLPMLEEKYNPNIKETLVRLAANAAEDDSVLERLATGEALAAEKVLEPYRASEQEKKRPVPTPLLKSIRLDAKKLRSLEPAVFKRVITAEFVKLGLNEGISAVHLNAVYNAVQKNVGGKTIEFPGGHTAELLAGALTLK